LCNARLCAALESVAWPDRDTDACPCHRWIIMAAVRSRCRHYIFALWFLSSFFYFFSSPNLSCRRLDLYHTSTHDVHGLSVKLECMCLRCAARGSLKIQDAKITPKFAICAPSHNLLGYIFATKACIDNRKKLVKWQYLLHMSLQYGELRPTNV